MASLAKAFDRIVRDYEARKIGVNQQSLFVTRPSFEANLEPNLAWLGIDPVMNWIDAIDRRSKLLAFGVDLRRYAYFDVHTPLVQLTDGGGYTLSPMGYGSGRS